MTLTTQRQPDVAPHAHSAARHHGSHAQLTQNVDVRHAPAGSLDAIIVPTARHSEQLHGAIDLASSLGCRLLALCSKKSHAAQVVELGRKRNVGVDAVDMDETPTPTLATSELTASMPFARASDLSGKRNLGLLLSRMLGWRHVLFLDDDITVAADADVRAAAGLLETNMFDAVGLHNDGYPDNSIVCHAHRDTGGRQDTFVSGGILAVAADRLEEHFPDVYCEDWFFLHDVERIAVTGSAFQHDYDPFGDPDRARQEELGDTLAEGLYWLRDHGQPLSSADALFWTGFLNLRRGLIREVQDRLHLQSASVQRDQARRALETAWIASEKITPQLCVDFMHAWALDRAHWRGLLAALPTAASVGEAVKLLQQRF